MNITITSKTKIIDLLKELSELTIFERIFLIHYFDFIIKMLQLKNTYKEDEDVQKN